MSPPKIQQGRGPIERLLALHGKSILDLARALGLTYATVWKAATGRQAMTRARAERYAAALRKLEIYVQWYKIM